MTLKLLVRCHIRSPELCIIDQGNCHHEMEMSLQFSSVGTGQWPGDHTSFQNTFNDAHEKRHPLSKSNQFLFILQGMVRQSAMTGKGGLVSKPSGREIATTRALYNNSPVRSH